METLDIARRIAEAAADKQATDVILLDTREVVFFADYFIVCSGQSDRQLQAIAEEIQKVLDELKVSYHREGAADSGWILIDTTDIVVHVFSAVAREFYGVDALWERAPLVMKMQ